MITERGSGILLHPSSLPGLYGSGDLGFDAYRFVDWLKSARQKYWQVLPLGEIGPGNSPYMSSSAFAGNVLMIDLVELAEFGWLSQEDLLPHPDFRDQAVDFARVIPFRMQRLRRAAQAFFASTATHTATHVEYHEFCRTEAYWLDDFALYKTLEERHGGRAWNQWANGFPNRNAQALQEVASSCAGEIGFWKFCQWCFARQWSKLRDYAHQRGVRIIGDVPIFVAFQSADVWAHQELFELDEQGRPSVVAGVPPDYFSETGQLWGNPLYHWEAHEQTGFAWWIARLKHALNCFDLVRIDHFRGFSSYWEIPADAPTAIHGRWVQGPGEKLFDALAVALGDMPIIAEDLGIITQDVIELRDNYHLPGMRVLQFAFGEDESNHFLPHHYIENTIAYTGTHDNDTAIGWWNSAPVKEKAFLQKYLATDGQAIQWDMMNALSASQANMVIYPMQDVLGLSGEHRMNYPGKSAGNWEWRFSWSQLKQEQTQLLAKISTEHNRASDC